MRTEQTINIALTGYDQGMTVFPVLHSPLPNFDLAKPLATPEPIYYVRHCCSANERLLPNSYHCRQGVSNFVASRAIFFRESLMAALFSVNRW